MPYNANFEADMDKFFPDPRKTPYDEILTAEVRGDLAFLPELYFVWVDEDGRIFIDSVAPLSEEMREQIDAAGYITSMQPTIGAGRVQYKLTRRE